MDTFGKYSWLLCRTRVPAPREHYNYYVSFFSRNLYAYDTMSKEWYTIWKVRTDKIWKYYYIKKDIVYDS